MTLEAFRGSPWKNSHTRYDGALISMRPAPEFATGEVLLAVTYRSLGFKGHREKEVPKAGRDFDRTSVARRYASRPMPPDSWRSILHGALQSPTQQKQSSKRGLQLSPIVPDAALYSNSARLAGNPWDPGQLVARIIALGSESAEAAESLWNSLFHSLGVGPDDDPWARWLQFEFEARRQLDVTWAKAPFPGGPSFQAAAFKRITFPAKQLATDLGAIVDSKPYMTRRQWVSLLESVMRVGSVAHVLWLGEVNSRYAEILSAALHAEPPAADVLEQALFAELPPALRYGLPALPKFRELTSRYLAARIRINLILWHLDSIGAEIPDLGESGGLHKLLQLVWANRGRLSAESIRRDDEQIADANVRELLCKKGIGSNLVEFCRYTLGQRQTLDDTLRGYDQGFTLKKRGESAQSPWILNLGPVALLAFSHCCLAGTSGPRSIVKLCEHLATYGIGIAASEVSTSQLGLDLRTLGLILDSPDAETGMLLVQPFNN